MTIEEIADGEVSPYLTDYVEPGSELEFRGPIGGYFAWTPAEAGPLLLVAGGSGIAPLMSMLRQRRDLGLSNPATLLASWRSVEEIIFRGYLAAGLAQASDGRPRPRVVIWSGVIAASLGFALLHPFLWHWDEAGFVLRLDAKGWFSSAAAFATSLWLYVARLAPWNPGHSLLPCFVGHGGKNLGVLAIKHAQGFVTGWFIAVDGALDKDSDFV